MDRNLVATLLCSVHGSASTQVGRNDNKRVYLKLPSPEAVRKRNPRCGLQSAYPLHRTIHAQPEYILRSSRSSLLSAVRVCCAPCGKAPRRAPPGALCTHPCYARSRRRCRYDHHRRAGVPQQFVLLRRTFPSPNTVSHTSHIFVGGCKYCRKRVALTPLRVLHALAP